MLVFHIHNSVITIPFLVGYHDITGIFNSVKLENILKFPGGKKYNSKYILFQISLELHLKVKATTSEAIENSPDFPAQSRKGKPKPTLRGLQWVGIFPQAPRPTIENHTNHKSWPNDIHTRMGSNAVG